MSEIDDIFASRGKSNVSHSIASSSTLPHSQRETKHKKKRKFRSEDDTDVSYHNKRSTPQTIVDPSITIPKLNRSLAARKPKVPKRTAQDDNRDKFKDSRGVGPRRKTTEGWLIYKEDELGIRDEGGDTPLCPFDCDCCF